MIMRKMINDKSLFLVFFVVGGNLFGGRSETETLEQVNETHQQTSKAEAILAYYARIIHHIEEKEFKAKKLKEIITELDFIFNTKINLSNQELVDRLIQLAMEYHQAQNSLRVNV